MSTSVREYEKAVALQGFLWSIKKLGGTFIEVEMK